MDLLQLSYFVEIAHLQNITKASEKLVIAQPSLSQSLQKLENELGILLFDRVGKSIKLNANGKTMLRYAEQILSLAESAKMELQDAVKQEKGTVRLQILCASSLIPDILASFKRLYSGINFKLVQNSEIAEYDFCITSTYNNVLPTNGMLLHDEEILLAVPHNHSLADRKTIRLDEVKTDTFISLDRSKQLRILTDAFCKAVNFTPNIVFESDNPALVRSLIAEELGVAFVPADTWERIDNDTVVYLHIERPICVRSLFITWPQNRYISKPGHLFLDFIMEYFKNKSWVEK